MGPFHFLLSGLGVIAITQAYRAYRMKNAADALDVKITSVKVGWGALSIKLNAKVKANNPTSQALQFTSPYLKVFVDETQVGNSTPSNEVIRIPARESKEFGIDLDLPITSVATLILGQGFDIFRDTSRLKNLLKLRVELWTKAMGQDIKTDIYNYAAS